MAIAFDAATESIRTATTDPYTFSHTGRAEGSGGVQGAMLCAIHGTSSTDHIVGVTYGGVAMTRAVTHVDTATEAGRADIWYVGAGLTGGLQTVSVDLSSATTDDFEFVCLTFTAGADTEVVDSDGIDENAANPQVTLQFGGRTCISVCALYGGGAGPASYTSLADQTRVADHDFTAFTGVCDRLTTPQTADDTIGYTSATDDVGFSAVAVSEAQAAEPFGPNFTAMSLTGVGH